MQKPNQMSEKTSTTKSSSTSSGSNPQQQQQPPQHQMMEGSYPMTLATGCPIAHAKNSLTAGPTGPVLLQDFALIEKMQYFTREKIPARNVHALGFGAHGTFTVTNSHLAQYSRAKLFSSVGKKTDAMIRFSGVFTEQGDPDTFRDLRGFAIKFYTEEGNWDLMCVNTPVFPVRDMKVGPDAIHAFKRDPRTAEWNPTQSWDFVATHPEGLNTMLMIYSDRVGTPLSFRHQNWYPCNTFSFVNQQKVRSWVRFHLISEQGFSGMSSEDAKLISAEDPNFYSREMRQSIEKGNFPKWKLYFQVMNEEEGYSTPQIAFDCTKLWDINKYPLIEIGTIEVNKFVDDYFAETEQVAFSPATVPPGISFSPDKLLQGRLLLYDDAQNYRLGPNFKQIPINLPRGTTSHTMYTGGPHRHDIKERGGWPHYYPSVLGNPLKPSPELIDPPMRVDGKADYYDMVNEGSDSDYYAQPRTFLKSIDNNERRALIDNIGCSLSKVHEKVTTTVLEHFMKIDSNFSTEVKQSIKDHASGMKKTPGRDKLKLLNSKLLGDPNMDVAANNSTI